MFSSHDIITVLNPSSIIRQSAGPSQPQSVPVQPERGPQKSEQSREEDRNRAEDRQVGPDWRRIRAIATEWDA
jgi:hypothetical protein